MAAVARAVPEDPAGSAADLAAAADPVLVVEVPTKEEVEGASADAAACALRAAAYSNLFDASTSASLDPIHWHQEVVGEDPTTAALPADREEARDSDTELVASPCKEAAEERWALRTILLMEARHCTTPETTVGDTAAETA